MTDAGPPIDLTDVVHAAGVGVLGIDSAGRVAACNQRAADLLGRSPDDLLGHPAHTVLHGDRDEEVCRFDLALAAAGLVEAEADDFRGADGAVVPVAWISSPLPDGAGVALVVRDATDQRAREAAGAADMARGRADLADARRTVAGLQRVAAITEALAETLDEVDVLQRLAELAVESLADVVVATLFDRRGVAVRVAGAAAAETGIDLLALIDDPAIGRVVGRGSDAVDAVLQGRVLRVDGDQLFDPHLAGDSSRELLTRVGATSAVLSPLIVRGHTLGSIAMLRRLGSPWFDDAEQVLIGDISRRAALAVENARLFREQRETALTLQTALLPATTTGLAVRSAARYLPAEADNRVGGDWYDLFAAAGDGTRTTMIIGDVAGHDIPAATTMSALRNLLRGIAVATDKTCAAVVELVDANLPNLGIAGTASTVMLTAEPLDAAGWELRWTNAGHLEPLLLLPDGTVELLEGVHGPLLGTRAGIRRGEGRRRVPAGTTVVMYTDGLVERRAEAIDDSIERLRLVAAGAGAVRDRPAELIDLLLAGVERAGADDVAVLACHLPSVTG